MADLNGSYFSVLRGDEVITHELGPGAAYSVMFDGTLLRIWDRRNTWVIGAKDLIILCIPNSSPRE